MENTEIIVVKQLPIIEEQLRTVQQYIQARVDEVLAMECTEDTVKEVKKARAELNAQRNDLEARRKEVKAKIEAPYKAFETVYKACAGDIFADADRKLAEKIRLVEDGLRQRKSSAVRAYFDEYRQSLNLAEDLADYRFAGINVTLSASDKSLKAKAKDFLDRLRDDLDLIDTQIDRDEVLTEYRSCRNVARAVQIVRERHARIEAERRRRAEEQEAQRKAQEHTAEVEQVIEEEEQLSMPEPTEAPADEFHAPVTEPVSEENGPDKAHVEPKSTNTLEQTSGIEFPLLYATAFKVTGTIAQLKALKQFIIDGGMSYEQLN